MAPGAPGATLRTVLTLPNRPETLPMARLYLEQLAKLAGLPPEEAAAFVSAAEEACANVIDHAYEPGEHGTLTVVGYVTPTELNVAVQDHGIPLDLMRAMREAAPARPRVSASDGLRMIQQAVDKAYWVQRGRDGKELRLIKRRPEKDVTQALHASELSRLAEDAPLAPPQEYRIIELDPRHALGVSRCMYRAYGNSYPSEDVYFPNRLTQLNQTGELVSCVALAAAGEVVGHYALERPGLRRVAERGMAVVSPEHRGRDLMGKMRVFIEEKARALGLVGVFSRAVTRHVYSQRVNEEFGSDVCAIYLADSPGEVRFKNVSVDKPASRAASVLYYTYVVPPPVAIVHAPPHHAEVIRRIYNGLKEPISRAPVKQADMTVHHVDFREDHAAPSGSGEVEVVYDHPYNVATISVRRIGADTIAEVRRAARDLTRVTGADVVYLEIPLAQEAAPELCQRAEDIGFFFAGIGPSFAADGDVLILQSPNVEIDMAATKLATPFATDLLRYIDSERNRVAARSKAIKAPTAPPPPPAGADRG